MNCGVTYLHLLKAYEQGLVTEEEITQAAERLFTTRYMLGCFTETEYDKIPYEVVECREHLELAQKIAREGMVLLKNDGTLPLQKDRLKTIGVIDRTLTAEALWWEIITEPPPAISPCWKAFRTRWRGRARILFRGLPPV